jgi:hypothetical protein
VRTVLNFRGICGRRFLKKQSQRDSDVGVPIVLILREGITLSLFGLDVPCPKPNDAVGCSARSHLVI